MNYLNHPVKTLYFLALTAAILYVPLCQAETSSEFLVFPNINLVYNSNLDDGSDLTIDDDEIGVDLFATLEVDNFRMLAEFLLTNKEFDFERLQVGWLSNNHLFWLGRFHNPVGYWNTRYHHGAYLQTSITRPSIIEYEELGGILPMHQTGVLVERAIVYGEEELGYSFAFGAGPEYTDELVPWDFLNPGSGSNDISLTLNLHRKFGRKIPATLGLFANYTIIPADVVDLDEIRQSTIGIYASWNTSHWRWHGSSQYVYNQLEHPFSSVTDAFINAYLQSEYQLNERWKFYARIEGTFGGEDDAYLDLFPGFIEDRVLGGVRWDLAPQNALKLELSANQTRQDRFEQVMLQWSAYF